MMETTTSENLLVIREKDTERSSGKRETTMSESGKMIRCMAKVSLSTKRVVFLEKRSKKKKAAGKTASS